MIAQRYRTRPICQSNFFFFIFFLQAFTYIYVARVYAAVEPSSHVFIYVIFMRRFEPKTYHHNLYCSNTFEILENASSRWEQQRKININGSYPSYMKIIIIIMVLNYPLNKKSSEVSEMIHSEIRCFFYRMKEFIVPFCPWCIKAEKFFN